jgi:fructokinase
MFCLLHKGTAIVRVGMHIVGIGELLWDLLPDGPRLGGAPLNVLINLRRLGHQVTCISGVGRDELGEAALRQLGNLGLDASFVAISEDLPTGTARVELDPDGVPSFSIPRPAAYDAVSLSTQEIDRIARLTPRVLIYGTLAQQTATTKESLRALSSVVADGIRFYDVNLRPGGWSPDLVRELTRMASVLKLNEQEAQVVADLFDVAPTTDSEMLCRELAARCGLQGVAITAGADGASVLVGGAFAWSAARKVDLVDTVGSGDAFSAALIDGVASGKPVEHIVRRATALGALVASRSGATPEWTLDEVAYI